MADLIVFWHRRDLRLADNLGLAAARAKTAKVVGLFCLDPYLLKPEAVAPARMAYLLESLAELQQSYRSIGSDLLILHQPPAEGIPVLASQLGARAIHWNWDVEPYAQARDRCVREALKEQGIAVHTGWDQLLHAPGQVRTQAGDPYMVYTPFWKNWRSQPKAAPAPSLWDCQGLTEAEQDCARQAGAVPLPSLQDLGFCWQEPLPLPPGEQAAWDRFLAFCNRDRTIVDYDQQRNCPAKDGTSRLSAAFKFGTLGIRAVWQEAMAAYQRCRSDRTEAGIEAWQQELAWREFYQHALYFFPDLAEGAYRERMQNFPWENDPDLFEAWCAGETGFPIVDAAMRQLNQTGWMHNRCRMIVASFLTKDLLISWQWGEQYFMQHLVDGDLSANNGGWQWSASSGMDPKPLRIFNPVSQAQKYDPQGEYIRHWLPDLADLSTESLITGEISPQQRQARSYPAPVVNHAAQRQAFRDRYQNQHQ
ncbi:FAD-binding domain-containing protein [Lyngbya confervoides]|uniref:Deoxyribodipyrimidine photo-lyase n=1 Tax=Lyngbya confervoides BDU141951 TaxID=1574623 RepID=A0ABD4T078_9CYAN|nr:FAD-binding domain-containing protein [Lyngbya confervoides]MCM1981702.1 deoxyribodipyrimidine photo-lyase [Lyngbya confervoides BDU141951]